MTVKEAAAWLFARDGFIIATHKRPDGDTLGCASALASALRRAGKTAWVMENADVTDRYVGYMGKYFAPADYKYENIVAVDIAAPGLFPVGHEKELEGHVGLCIDHHPSNSMYAENTCLDGTCAACGEIIYDVIMEMNGDITPEEADYLYIAISTDTGCFSYANVTYRTFLCASMCCKAGAGIHRINKDIFRTKTRNRIELEAKIFSGMEFYEDGRIAVVLLPKSLLDGCRVDENDLEDIAALPGIVEGVEASLIIRELDDGKTKVSMRSGETVNSSAVCQVFGGGGHAMAAGCTLDVSIYEARDALVKETIKVL